MSAGDAADAAAGHVPVLRDRILALLGPALEPDGAVLVDATLGRAGHARALLAAHPGLSLVGIDADETAIDESRQRLTDFAGRVTLVRAFYDELPAILARLGLRSVQGILFDLGVSSPQLDDRERGFAYSYDAPLDMRMDTSSELTAAEVVNTYPADRLARVLRDYGEERFARRIADALVRERDREPLTSTRRLAQIVADSIPAPARRTGGNPAKRTFQALRIEVNGELDRLHRALPAACDAIAVQGRARGAGLPLAGGPRGQAGAGRALGGHHPAGPAGFPARQQAAVPPPDQGRRKTGRAGTDRQPAGRVRPPAGRRTYPDSRLNGGAS